MANYSYKANSETLLLLAWLSTIDLSELSRKDHETRPWYYLQQYGRERGFPEELIHTQIALALECFERDPIYGPLFEALVRERITFVDFSLVALAIELRDLADPSAGLFFSNHSSEAQHQSQTEHTDETDVFWSVVALHAPFADRLTRMSRTWNGDICRGASELQAFFDWYLELAARSLQMPFFLVEFLRMSQCKVNWHAIAQKALNAPHPGHSVCHCADGMREAPIGITAEYLGELFKATGDEAALLGQQLQEPARTQALFLVDLCRETTKMMRLYLIYGEVH